jgi:hypothetical protein
VHNFNEIIFFIRQHYNQQIIYLIRLSHIVHHRSLYMTELYEIELLISSPNMKNILMIDKTYLLNSLVNFPILADSIIVKQYKLSGQIHKSNMACHTDIMSVNSMLPICPVMMSCHL